MSTDPALVPRAPGPVSLRAEVRASQWGRLLVAMSDVVADKGYAAATVADVLALAGVSRKTFYEHFADKQACFLAAYEHGADALLQAVTRDLAAADGPDDAAAIAIGTFLGMLSGEPGFARAFLVEVWSAGPEALKRHAAVLDGVHGLMRALHEQARAADPTIVPATDAQIAAVTGGISRVATIEILAGRAAGLTDLTDELVAFARAVLARPA